MQLYILSGVIEAAKDMRPYLQEGKDCWIVILTDGFFWEENPMDAETLSKNLYEITAPNAYGRAVLRSLIFRLGIKGTLRRYKKTLQGESMLRMWRMAPQTGRRA